MDFTPDAEFHPIFDRTSKRVNLEGCATAQEVNARLRRKINEYKATDTEGPLEQFQLEKKIRSLRTLVEAGFARRTIHEAMANPQGKVALTLKYGRKKALLILSRRRAII
jgi:hypothetical protein